MHIRSAHAILELLSDAESVGSVEACHAELLAALAVGFGCDVVVFNEFRIGRRGDPSGAPAICSVSPPLEPTGAIPPALCARSPGTCASIR